MANISITLACVDYFDRTRPIIDGQVETPGIDLTCVPLPPRELGVRYSEFDVSEVAISIFMALRSSGDDRFVGIPVFPYRAFPFGNIVVNVSSGIERPQDLVNKRVGTTGLHLAGTLWTRGFLKDTYAIKSSQLQLFVAGRPRLELPPDIRVEVIPFGRTLSEMVEKGEIHAWIGSSLPECFLRGSSRVRRLFPNYRQIEEEYARRTGFFPILHTLVMHRDLYKRHPWIAGTLLRIFDRAKQIGALKLQNEGNFACGLPWLRHDLEELPKIFGGDCYRYGFQANHQILSTIARYADEQGLTSSPLDVAELFASETRE